MTRTQKRKVKATIQSVNTPDGLESFISKLENQPKVTIKRPILRNSDEEEEYCYELDQNFQKILINSSIHELKDCFWSVVSVEYPRNQKTNSKGKILPRGERVNTNDVLILLIKESNLESRLITITSYPPDIGRVNKFIGESRISMIDETNHISNDFFVWMYYSYSKNEAILDDLNINNIIGFTGVIADDTNKIMGSSDSTPDLLITKAFVSNGYRLRSLRFDLNDTFLNTIVAINEDLSLLMDLNATELNLDSLSSNDVEQTVIRSVAYIYAGLLPSLLKKYDSKKNDFASKNKNFSKEIGIEVVQAIINRNNISNRDLDFDYI